ncbi:MAG: type II secretion system protein [bacterium]
MTFDPNKKKNLKKAFTLIELLVVIAIISLLSAVVLNSLAGARMKANDAKISEDLRQFRIAAELYFNDNHTYPPTDGSVSLKNQNSDYLRYSSNESGWSNKLSFFIRTVEAASVGHTKTALCKNFDNVALALVSRKYLATVPIHPYDDDSKGICYKAVNAATSFAAYAVLTTQVSVQGTNYNKRTGFILGDTSSTGTSLIASPAFTPSDERPYPVDSAGAVPSSVSSSVDAVAGITAGAPAAPSGISGIIYSVTNSCPSGQEYGPVCGGYSNPPKACQTPFTGTRVASAWCENGVQDPYSDHCTKTPIVSSVWGISVANAFGNISLCPLGWTMGPCGACDIMSGTYGG